MIQFYWLQVVKADEVEAQGKADDAEQIKLECDADLSVVLPAINSAMAALNTLTSAVSCRYYLFLILIFYNIKMKKF